MLLCSQSYEVLLLDSIESPIGGCIRSQARRSNNGDKPAVSLVGTCEL